MAEMSLSGFIFHLAAAKAEIDHMTHKALERAALVIEKEAKAEIGHYQSSSGPFSAWQELADATKADRASKGFPENDPLLRTGEMRDSIGHVVHGHEATIGSDSDIAVYQELGTSRIPARSFLGGAAFRKAERVAEIVGSGVAMALVGERVITKILPPSRD